MKVLPFSNLCTVESVETQAALRQHGQGRTVGSISKLGARRFEGTFSLREKGISKKGHFFAYCKSWGHVPPMPPASYVYDHGSLNGIYSEGVTQSLQHISKDMYQQNTDGYFRADPTCKICMFTKCTIHI